MSTPNKLSLSVFTVIQDDQSGGFNVNIYNTHHDWLDEHIEDHGLKKKDYSLKTEKGLANREQLMKGLEEDEYQNGYTSNSTMNLIEVAGKWQLEKPFHAHGGQ